MDAAGAFLGYRRTLQKIYIALSILYMKSIKGLHRLAKLSI